MAVAEELQILVDAKVGAAVRDLKKLETQTKGNENSAKKLATSFLKGAAAFGGATLSIGALVSVLKSSVGLYAKQVEAEQTLAAAIRSTGGDVDTLLPKYKEFASSLQDITVVGDEVTLGLIQQAKSLGVTDDKIEEATQGAIGLSDSLGIGLQQALRGVSNAMNGEYTTLQRYIPALRTANTEAEKQEILQRAMADGFEVSKAKADTATGAIEQLKNTVGDYKEGLGEAVAQGIKPFVVGLTEMIQESISARERLRELSAALSLVYGRANTEGMANADILASLRTGYQELTDRANTLRATIKENENGTERWQEAVVLQSKTALAGIEAQRAALERRIAGVARLVGEEKLAAEAARESGAAAVEADTAAMESAAVKQEQERSYWSERSDWIENWKNHQIVAAEEAGRATDILTARNEALAATMQNQVASAYTSAFSAIGDALAQGESGTKAFAKAALLGIASVLDALAAELAARAVLGLFVNPALVGPALAGAAAASVAAGVVRSNANGSFFEQGTGGDFVVPEGFNNDDYMIGVSSGERVNVSNSNQTNNMSFSQPIIIQIDGTPVYRGMLKASRNGLALVDSRAVVRT